MEPSKLARTPNGPKPKTELPQDLRDLLERHPEKKRSKPAPLPHGRELPEDLAQSLRRVEEHLEAKSSKPTSQPQARELPDENVRGPQHRVEAPPAMKRSKPARMPAFLFAGLALAALVMILELRMHHVRAASATAAPGNAPVRIESEHGRPAPAQPGYHHRSKTVRNG